MIKKYIAFCLLLALMVSCSLGVSAQALAPITQEATGQLDQAEEFTVIFQNWDGKELSKGTYHYGEEIKAPEKSPTKAADGTYVYDFIGWDAPVGTCTGNQVFTAVYEKKPYFNIDDLLEDTKIKNIAFYPISITERTDGQWVGDGSGRYYHYNWQQAIYYKVNGEDVIFSGPQFTYRGKQYTLTFTDPQSFETPWTAGNTYTVPISVGDVTGKMKITIKPRKDLPGDCNGDGYVNNEDVIHLLWHTLFEEDYPLACNGDVNGDGYVNNEDVIHLLWHTLFEEDYPLAR